MIAIFINQLISVCRFSVLFYLQYTQTYCGLPASQLGELVHWQGITIAAKNRVPVYTFMFPDRTDTGSFCSAMSICSSQGPCLPEAGNTQELISGLQRGRESFSKLSFITSCFRDDPWFNFDLQYLTIVLVFQKSLCLNDECFQMSYLLYHNPVLKSDTCIVFTNSQ